MSSSDVSKAMYMNNCSLMAFDRETFWIQTVLSTIFGT